MSSVNDDSKTNSSKQSPISKKWLYGSLAVIALILGLILDSDARVADDQLSINTVDQAEIVKDDGEVKIDTTVNNESYKSYEDDFMEDDAED